MVLARLSDRTPFFVGLSLGIAVALIVLPILEDRCFSAAPRRIRVPAQHLPNSDDYEPIINLQGSPEFNKAKEARSQQVRPRYFSTELGIREKLLLAVVTSASTFHSRAFFLNQTLASEVKVVKYFVITEEANDKSKTPVLSNVDFIPASSENKHASLLALELIAQKYIKDYDFLFIVTDTTYVHVHQLLQLVGAFSVNHIVHLGTTDSGSVTQSQCYLNSGILLSHNLVQQTASRLQECHRFQADHFKETFLSYCVYFLTQVPCSPVFQGTKFSSLHVGDLSGLPDWPHLVKSTTVQPILEGKDFLRLHEFVCHQHLENTYDQISAVKLTEPWPLGIQPQFKPLSRFHVITWTYFNETHVLPAEERVPLFRYSDKPKHAHLENAIQSCKVWHRATSQVPLSMTLVDGYTRVDPTRGVEYILDFRTNVTTSFHRFTLFRPLSQSEMLPVPYVTEHTRIIILVPVTAQEALDAVSFLEKYETTCLKKQENTALVLILLYNATDPGKDSENDVFKGLKAASLTYANKYRSVGAKLVWYSIRTLKSGVSIFPILDLVMRKLPSSSLILLCQVRAAIDAEYLNRVRMNTIAKSQVFFPIPFIQYNPSLSGEDVLAELEVKKQSGIFDSQDYTQCSFYILDYVASRLLIERELPVAIVERDLTKIVYYEQPINLIDMFLMAVSLHVLRAVEPQLKIPYRYPVCSVETSPHCRARYSRTLGAKSHLAKFILLERLKQAKYQVPKQE